MSHKRQYMRAGLLWLSSILKRGHSEFRFDGHIYPYFNHRYNVTWLNERRVEIPIARNILLRHPTARILEVGNVLSHYDRTLGHATIDKYEKERRSNLFAEDAVSFFRGAPYDLIVSISTLEHVGWDETPRDEDKISRTLQHLRGLLSSDGEMVFTAPVGYSPPLDRAIDAGIGFIELRCLRRTNVMNEWEETDWAGIRNMKFHSPYPFANGLVVARLKSAQAKF